MMLTYFAVIMVTLVLMSIYILGVLGKSLYSNESVKLFAKANIVSGTITPYFEDNASNDTSLYTAHVLAGTNIRGIAVNPSCTVMYDSGTEASLVGKVLMRDIINTAMTGEHAQNITQTEDGKTVMAVAVPIISKEKTLGVVYLYETLEDIDKIIDYVKVNLFIFSVLISILIGMLSMGISLVVTSPIDNFIRVAKEISKGNYKMRLPVHGKNELAEMAEAMNSMCRELENIDETHKKFISDVSHELKTPLATIKLICDSIVAASEPDIEMVQEFLSDLSNEVDRLTRIVERLLTLTKIAREEEQPTLTPVDFNVMLNAIVSRLEPAAKAKHIMLFADLAVSDLPPVLIDYDRIWEALYNITDNAIKYTPENGTVRLDLQSDDRELEISISDNGPGIPEAERDKIFDRFYRLDDSRTRDTGGTGLGLAIAKEAVLLHGGNITVSESEQGGCKFTVTLPRRTNDTTI